MGYVKLNLTNSKPFKLLWLKETSNTGIQGHPVWECLCDCGTITFVLSHLHKTQRTCGQCSKWCADCETYKPLTDFPKNRAKKDGFHSSCILCSREHSLKWRLDNPEKAKSNDLKKKTGATLKQKQDAIKDQDGKCAACGTSEPGGRFNEWCTDHDHATGKFRGVLCAYCNLTLGNAKEDISRLKGLIIYLEKHNTCIDLPSR